MKVLMIVSWYSPQNAEVFSAGVFHYEQALALQPHCDVAVYYPYDSSINSGFTKNVEKGVLTFRGREIGIGPLKYVKNIIDFSKICKEFKPDIIHAHVGMAAGKMATILGKIFGIPVIITEHAPIEMMNLEDSKCKRACDFAYGNSKYNICVSEDQKNKLAAIFSDQEFTLLYNGVSDPLSKEFESTKYAIDDNINCCIVAAFYDRYIKGYQYLLPAIKKLIEQGYRIKLHICGGGEHQKYYEELAKELRIEDSCIFYGQCGKEKVYTIINQMDFCVSSSIFESAGVSVQEAMLLGKPLVVTKSGGANSLTNNDSAIVVDKESVDELVTGMSKMIQSLELYDGETIRKYAYENFEIGKVTEKHMELYRKVLCRKGNL